MSSSSVSGISFAGLASGLDTTTIIQKLLAIEGQPITDDQNRISTLQNTQSLYAQLKSLVSALGTAASALNSSSAFGGVSATTSDSTVASATSSTGATAGTYDLTVTQLAKAEKVISTAQSDTTSALGLTGEFVLNGKAIAVASSDSLTTIASSINSANVGVTASVVNGGTGQAYLSLASKNTGKANSIQLADLTGTAMGSLGLLTGSKSIRSSITNGAQSYSFSSSTTAISSLLGVSDLNSATVQINGVNVTIGPGDSLQTIANNINSAGAGATATVASATDASGTTTYKLQVVGTSGTPTFADNQNVLAGLGVLQQNYGNELVQATDANYKLDNLSLTSASNTISDVIPGVTFTLLKGTVASPGTATISVTQDTSGAVANVQALISSYNSLKSFITTNTAYDASSKKGGALLGDGLTSQVANTVSSALFNVVPGLSTYNNLTSVGVSMGTDGMLSLDTSALTKALTADATQVTRLFQSFGTTTNANLTYVSSTSKSVASGAGAYAVNITQLATKGSYTGSVAQTTASTSAEQLTFNGALFANTDYYLTLDVGSTASDAVNKINNDAKLKNSVVASLDTNGKLLIASKKYGTLGNFTVTSSMAAATNNSGIGNDGLGTAATGVDVAGTINGEAATGTGQFLLGNTGNANTEGLQIQYTGTTLGAVGSMSFEKGIGAQYSDTLSNYTDTVNGVFKTYDDNLTSRIDQLNQDITTLNASLAQRKAYLTQQFAAMEQAIAKLQSQGNSLSAISSLNLYGSTSSTG